MRKNFTTACSCGSSQFLYPPAGHIVTGDLNIIDNADIRNIFAKGAKYRLPYEVNWDYVRNTVISAIDSYVYKLSILHRISTVFFDTFKVRFMKILDNHIRFFINNSSYTQNLPMSSSVLKRRFIIAPADKAGNNYVFICRKYYLEVMAAELGIMHDLQNNISVKGNSVYSSVDFTTSEIISKHISLSKYFGLNVHPN